MLETLRAVIAAIRNDLGQLDAALVNAEAERRELPHLPTAKALVELARVQEKLAKTTSRMIALARKPPREPGLFDQVAEKGDESEEPDPGTYAGWWRPGPGHPWQRKARGSSWRDAQLALLDVLARIDPEREGDLIVLEVGRHPSEMAGCGTGPGGLADE